MMADTDLITLDEAHDAINMVGSGANHAPELAMWVTAVSERIDDLCGPVVIRTVTDEIHYANGQQVIFPTLAPVASITTVTEYRSGSPTVLTAEDFDSAGTYLLQNGFLYRRSSWSTAPFLGVVKITYEAGRYASTDEVGAKFKLAAGAILRRLWAREASAWSRGGSVFEGEPSIGFFKVFDPMIEEILGGEMSAPSIA